MESLRFIKRHPASIIFACFAIYIMLLIFSFSAQTGEVSSGVSKSVSEAIAKLLVEGFSSLSQAEKLQQVKELVPIVRKVAHFLVYAALGFFSLLSALSFLREGKKDIIFKKVLFGTSVFCLLYAASDEIHQLFVLERSGSTLDVILDFCGACFGMAVSLVIFRIFCKVIDKSTRKKEIYQK